MVWQFALMAPPKFDFVAAVGPHVKRTVQNFRDQRIVLINAGKPPVRIRVAGDLFPRRPQATRDQVHEETGLTVRTKDT